MCCHLEPPFCGSLHVVAVGQPTATQHLNPSLLPIMLEAEKIADHVRDVKDLARFNFALTQLSFRGEMFAPRPTLYLAFLRASLSGA